MTVKLYELAGADDDLLFSPNCWRARMALAHKGLDVETVPWRFTEKDDIAFSGQGLVPVMVDGDTAVSDSWKIVHYLEETYPDAPSLFGGDTGKALTAFYNNWANGFLGGQLVPLIITDVHACLAEKDKAYFRESREKRFGTTLEEFGADPEARIEGFRAALTPLRMTLKTQPFLGGEQPLYADHTVFGMFMWARCTSPLTLLETDDPVYAWRERLLDSYGGIARDAQHVTAA